MGGSLVIEDDEVYFVTYFTRAVTRDDRCVGVAIKRSSNIEAALNVAAAQKGLQNAYQLNKELNLESHERY